MTRAQTAFAFAVAAALFCAATIAVLIGIAASDVMDLVLGAAK